MKQPLTIDELINQAKQAMEGDGLKQDYITQVSYTWWRLKDYLSDNGIPFSRESALCFLENHYGIKSGNNFAHLRPIDKRRSRAVHILINCAEDGKITKEKSFWPCMFHEPFAVVFNQFLSERKSGSYALSTINRDIYTLNHLSKYLYESKIGHLADIDASSIMGFMKWLSASKNLPTVKSASSSLRLLLKYLYVNKYVEKDLSTCVQTVRVRKVIPSVYGTGEIETMLDSFNRFSALGIRNYAMVLIAVRLGMRASDICGLKFSAIHWDKSTIEFITRKTGKHTVLPLPADVGNAIIKYLKDCRPNVDDNHVFLQMQAPHHVLKPASLHTIVTKAFRDAGIVINSGRRHGPHALRASLATAMLEKKVPLPVISETLSHSITDTTKIYLKVDIYHLRPLALEVPGIEGIWMGGIRL